DYDVKLKSIVRFLDEGDKVRVTLRFRGREMMHHDLGMQLLERMRTDLGDKAKIEQSPRLEGRQMVMALAPNKS
ncbi:MAG TPA: translation initiation factor IF-3, partial [Alphaproteobacteria bacterium]|nr:translation initiation factor IF-3 [Alphaproteobacteria bacterium]